MKKYKAIFYAIFAAALYALNAPLSKLLLKNVSAAMMAAFLYLGAGAGLAAVGLLKKASGKAEKELPLTKRELPSIIGMIVLDIAAPIFLMAGLSRTSAGNVSLLNNFEIVSTSIIAMLLFGEKVSKRLWAAISLVTFASILLSFDDINSLSFSAGSIFVLLACICWGIENNCTRILSEKNPLQIVVIKGFGSGLGSLVIALAAGENIPVFKYIVAAMLLGFIAYGFSIFFYVYAQRELGAARTSTYYAVSPFIGVLLSWVMLREMPSYIFIIALIIMIAGTYLASAVGKRENNEKQQYKNN